MPSDFERLSLCFSYEPESGNLIWLIQQGNGYPGRKAGFPVGDGYLNVRLDGRSYSVHRVAWLLMTRAFPKKGMQIDHINGDRKDNRWCNLRLATKAQNAKNRGTNRNNTSGVMGVSFNKAYGKWLARIMVDNRSITLGFFDSIEPAAAARRVAEEKYFGEFARKTA